MRSTMGQEKLTSLALMAAHIDRIGYDDAPKILELFALKNLGVLTLYCSDAYSLGRYYAVMHSIGYSI